MSISVNTDWEIRTTGAETNGGGFKDLNPGTSVDYSQQDAAQLALSDIASNGAGTGLYSATGGFTAAMVGNCMYISGTGFTTGWYQITGYTDTNNITIDRSCGASASGGVGNVGGAWDIQSQANWNLFFNTTNKSNYNKFHIKAGTYSISGFSSLTLAAQYGRLLGYNTTRGDQPTADNRPLIDAGDSNGYVNWTGAYGFCQHIRFNSSYSTSSSNTLYMSGSACTMQNCKVTRSGYNAVAFGVGSQYAKIYQSEFESTLGSGLQLANNNQRVEFCWIHDCGGPGVTYSGASSYASVVANCVISNCGSYGVQLYYGSEVWGNTIYNCGTGIYFSNPVYCSTHSNIIHSCTTGINSSESHWTDFEIVYNCTTPYTGGVVAGPNSLTSNPLLVDPANDDFTLAATSPAFNTGMKLGAIVGLP